MRRAIWVSIFVLAASPEVSLAAPADEPVGQTPAGGDHALDGATRSQEAQHGFLRQLGEDFGRIFSSRQSLLIIGVGGAAALFALPADDGVPRSRFNSELYEGTTLDGIFEPGQHAGGALAQFGGALGTLAIGKLTGNRELGDLGAELTRAQIVSGTITQAVKLATHRERPDGSSRLSFPSGHSTAAFATATVLERRYGAGVGIPAYALATWIAASRLNENKHYLSDVAFGAAIGVAAGRAVTFRHGGKRWSLAPQAIPGGGLGVRVTLGGVP